MGTAASRFARAAAHRSLVAALLIASSPSVAAELGTAEPASGWRATHLSAAGEVTAVAQADERTSPSAPHTLWIGGPDGLARYDGTHLDRVDDEALRGRSRTVRRIAISPDGTPWVATGEAALLSAPSADGELVHGRGVDAGLFVVRDGALRAPPFAAQLPSAWVWAMAFDRDGVMWIGTEQGLVRVHGRDLRVFGVADGLPSAFVTSIVVAASGSRPTLWVGTARGLARVEGDAITRVPGAPYVTAIAGSPPVVVGSRQLHDEAGRPLGRDPPRGVDLVLVARDGSRWLTSASSVYRQAAPNRDPELVVRDASGVRDLLEDHEGSVWLASGALGLLHLRPTAVRSVPLPWPDPTVFSILHARDGTFWYATTQGVAAVKGGDPARWWRVGPTVNTWSPRSLVEAPDGRVLLASLGEPLSVYERGSWRRARGSATDHVDAMLVTRAGDLVAATPTGVLRFPHADVDSAGAPVGDQGTACAGSVGPMLEARDGSLWMGTRYAGVTVVRGGVARCLTVRDGLPSNRIAALHEDGDGAIWVGSLDAVGLAVLRGDRVIATIDDEGDGPRRAFAMAEDARGGFWITSDNGVATIAKRELDARVGGRAPRAPLAWRRFRARDGLPHDQCMSWFGPTLAFDGDGRLIVATLLGAAAIDPARLPPRPTPLLAIDEVLGPNRRAFAMRTRGAEPPLVSLASTTDAFDVGFTATTFLDAESLGFRYRFEGVDRDWIDAGPRRTLHVTRLPPPGRSTLVLQAFDAGAPVGAPARLAIDVRGPLWQRPEVVAPALLLALLIASAAHRLRVRRVEARYRIVGAERARIARDLHDGLAQGFTSIALHLDALKLALGSGAPPMAERFLARARAVVERSRTDAHRAVWNLRAQGPERLSIAAAVERVAVRAADETGTSVSFALAGEEPTPGPLTAELEHELPLVTQEAITNAVRHGHARHVEVLLRNDGRELSLSIRDDGAGFDPAAVRAPAGETTGGFGLIGIQERATRIGARVELDARLGGGACITLTVPLGPTPAPST